MLISFIISLYTFFDIPTNMCWLSPHLLLGIFIIFLKNEKAQYFFLNGHESIIAKQINLVIIGTYYRKTCLLIIHFKFFFFCYCKFVLLQVSRVSLTISSETLPVVYV
jgi:hypothetical protein